MGLCVRLVRGLALCCLVLGGTFVGTGLASVASSGAAVAQAVNSIVVEGNRRVEADDHPLLFQGRPGRPARARPDRRRRQGALRAPACSRTCSISLAGGRLVVTVVENPVINRVAFEGNKKAKDEQLKAEVQSKPRGTLSKPTVQADVQRIVEIYHRSGRFDVSVDPKIIELPNNRVDLVFEINEGEKTGVKDINFVGVHAFSRGRLNDVIKTGGKQLAELPADHRHLRSRPRRGRPRPAAPLLSQARLCRRAHRLGGRRIRSGAARASSSPSRSRKAPSTTSARST